MAYKLVVADESPSVLRVVEMAFSESKIEVFPFRDGIEMLNALSKIKPDAILVCLSLPRKDGYEVGRYLRSQDSFREIPLIILKNAFEPLDQERLGFLQFEGILEKPFDSQKLVQMVEKAITRNSAPPTLPEEPLPEDTAQSPVTPRPHETEERKQPPPGEPGSGEERNLRVDPGLAAEIQKRVVEAVKGEILELEVELEKRIRAQLSAEFREKDVRTAGTNMDTNTSTNMHMNMNMNKDKNANKNTDTNTNGSE